MLVQGFAKRRVAGRGQSHHFDVGALRHLESRAIGGFARCTGQQPVAGAHVTSAWL